MVSHRNPLGVFIACWPRLDYRAPARRSQGQLNSPALPPSCPITSTQRHILFTLKQKKSLPDRKNPSGLPFAIGHEKNISLTSALHNRYKAANCHFHTTVSDTFLSTNLV